MIVTKLFKAGLIASALMFSHAAFAAEITVRVNGMVCAFCATGIEKSFTNHEAVDAVDVDLSAKVVKVTTKVDSTLTDEQITSMIVDSGYHVVAIERD